MAKRILIVDDERHVVKVVRDMLLRRGYTVSFAFDGEEALRKTRLEHPDVVLLDILIPKMDGTSVAQRLRDLPDTSDIPVIFLTGLMRAEESRRRGPRVGGRYFLAKPFDAQQLYEIIELACGGVA